MQNRKEIRYPKLILTEAICLLSVPFFFVVVWMPVYHAAFGDVLLQDSLFLLLWDFLKDGLTYLFYWFSIAFLGVSLLLFGWKGSLPFFGFYLLASAFRSVGTAVSSAIVLRSLGEELIENIGYAFLDVLYDVFLMGAFCLIFYFAAMRGRGGEVRKDLLPPGNRFQPVPLHLSVLLSVAVYYAVQLFGRIRYDLFYGAPVGGNDLAWMIFYYVADLALAAFGYFAVLLMMKLLTKKKA